MVEEAECEVMDVDKNLKLSRKEAHELCGTRACLTSTICLIIDSSGKVQVIVMNYNPRAGNVNKNSDIWNRENA